MKLQFNEMTTEQTVEYFMTENAKSYKRIEGLQRRLNLEIDEYNKRGVYINRNTDKYALKTIKKSKL